MIILLTTLITKGTMLGTNIPIDLTGHTINPLFLKRLFFIIKDSPRIEEEQCRIQKWQREHEDDDNYFKSLSKLSKV